MTAAGYLERDALPRDIPRGQETHIGSASKEPKFDRLPDGLIGIAQIAHTPFESMNSVVYEPHFPIVAIQQQMPGNKSDSAANFLVTVRHNTKNGMPIEDALRAAHQNSGSIVALHIGDDGIMRVISPNANETEGNNGDSDIQEFPAKPGAKVRIYSRGYTELAQLLQQESGIDLHSVTRDLIRNAAQLSEFVTHEGLMPTNFSSAENATVAMSLMQEIMDPNSPLHVYADEKYVSDPFKFAVATCQAYMQKAIDGLVTKPTQDVSLVLYEHAPKTETPAVKQVPLVPVLSPVTPTEPTAQAVQPVNNSGIDTGRRARIADESLLYLGGMAETVLVKLVVLANVGLMFPALLTASLALLVAGGVAVSSYAAYRLIKDIKNF